MKTRWKVFKAGLQSNNGDIKWKRGEWQTHKGKLSLRSSGFHCSRRIIDAMQYTPAEIIAQVEVKGKSLKDSNKECWEKMRIIKTYEWTKEDSVSLAIFGAELVLFNFEKEFPDDKRPREAIEAAKRWLREKSETAKSAAWSAVWSAESSKSAKSAKSAESAGWSAVWSEGWSEGYQKTLNKCEKFILKRLEDK